MSSTTDCVRCLQKDEAIKRAYKNGVKKGLAEPTKYIMSLPFEAHTTEGLEKIVDECIYSQKMWFKGVLVAVEGEYTNKKGVTSKCWNTINGKYHSRRIEGEEPPTYVGYANFIDTIFEVTTTKLQYKIASYHNNLITGLITYKDKSVYPKNYFKDMKEKVGYVEEKKVRRMKALKMKGRKLQIVE